MVTPIKLICDLFKYNAPIVFIIGRFGYGKTDFSLLIAETLLKYGVVKKVGTNIKVEHPNFDYITNVVYLKKWLVSSKAKKLFILDEAGIHIDTRNPLSRINREIRHLGFLLRKFRGKFIFVSQRAKDIEGTFRDTDIWLATFHKFSLKKALLISNIYDEPIIIENIPKTSIPYDTYDIALFGLEPSSFEAESINQQMLKAWLEGKSFRQIARDFGYPQATQVIRIIREEVKHLIASLMP